MMQALLKNTSPWQPQGYLIQQHTDVNDHRSIFLKCRASAMSTEDLFVFGVLCLCLELLGEVSYIWRVLWIQRFLPCLHLTTQSSSPWKGEGSFLGGSGIIRLCSATAGCQRVVSMFWIQNSYFLSLSRIWPTQHLVKGCPWEIQVLDWEWDWPLWQGFPTPA